MNPADVSSTPVPPQKTLRLLFLTLFLRGRGSRGLQKQQAPKSIGSKLALTLVFYAAFGFLAAIFIRQPVFALSAYLHAMTFVFLGMFVASSAGEILFNKEEADILLHRPITAKALLWAKVRVLVEVSLWLAGAFNLVGFVIGIFAPDGGWRFPFAHAVSTTIEAMFCTGCVIMVYQLCLRYFGRERLEGLMTAAQVIVSVAAVLIGQIVPQVMLHMNHVVTFDAKSWWIALLPPAWFAGFDDALAGSGAKGSWLLAAIAVVATVIVLWLAFEKLAGDYQTGLQRLGESASKPKRGGAQRRLIDRLVDVPPLRWWLRDPVARASFLLTTAYLARDRDVKLRVYPGLAPMLILPFITMIQGWSRRGASSDIFGAAFAGGFFGVIPLLALSMLQYSQQWQASDVFRVAPMHGPAAICDGARRAVLCFLTFPLAIALGLIIWLSHRDATQLLLLLPGIISAPLYALLPSIGGKCIPLSMPSDEAKSANRGRIMFVAMFSSMALAGLASLTWSHGYFWWLILVEAIVVVILYGVIRFTSAKVLWPSME